jgi:hypothetical protein
VGIGGARVVAAECLLLGADDILCRRDIVGARGSASQQRKNQDKEHTHGKPRLVIPSSKDIAARTFGQTA